MNIVKADLENLSKEQLIAIIEGNQADLETIVFCVKKLLSLFGLLNAAGNVEPAYLDGSKNVVGAMMKSLGDLSLDMSTAKTLGKFRAGKDAAARIAEKTDFINELLVPIVLKYNI